MQSKIAVSFYGIFDPERRNTRSRFLRKRGRLTCLPIRERRDHQGWCEKPVVSWRSLAGEPGFEPGL